MKPVLHNLFFFFSFFLKKRKFAYSLKNLMLIVYGLCHMEMMLGLFLLPFNWSGKVLLPLHKALLFMPLYCRLRVAVYHLSYISYLVKWAAGVNGTIC